MLCDVHCLLHTDLSTLFAMDTGLGSAPFGYERVPLVRFRISGISAYSGDGNLSKSRLSRDAPAFALLLPFMSYFSIEALMLLPKL